MKLEFKAELILNKRLYSEPSQKELTFEKYFQEKKFIGQVVIERISSKILNNILENILNIPLKF